MKLMKAYLLIIVVFVSSFIIVGCKENKALENLENNEVHNLTIDQNISENTNKTNVNIDIQLDTTKDKIKYATGKKELDEGMVSYSIRDCNGRVLEFAEKIKLDDNSFEGYVTLEQNLKSEVNYRLIFLSNYKQSEFLVNDEKLSFYDFTLEGHERIEIPILLNVNDEVIEISFMIVTEPEKKDYSIETEEDFTQYMQSKRLYSWRLITENETGEVVDNKTVEKWKTTIINDDFTMDISNNEDSINLVPYCSSNDKLYIHLKNCDEETTEFGLITLVDSKQCALISENQIEHIELQAKESIVIEVNVANIIDNTSIQFFLYKNPYSKDIDYRDFISCSYRTIIIAE